MCCTRLAANTAFKKSPFWHHRTTLSGYIFGTKACIDNWKTKLDKQQYLLHISWLTDTDTLSLDITALAVSSAAWQHSTDNNMVNLLMAETCWRVWGTPANFNSFRVLAALLHGILVLGISQTLRRWTEGATLGRAAITLGIGPHSSFVIVFPFLTKRLAWGTSPEWPCCVEWDVRPQLSQSTWPVISAPIGMTPLEFHQVLWHQKTKSPSANIWLCFHEMTF